MFFFADGLLQNVVQKVLARPIHSTHACDSIRFCERSTSCFQMFVIIVPSPPTIKTAINSKKICAAPFYIFDALGVRGDALSEIEWGAPYVWHHVFIYDYMISNSVDDFLYCERKMYQWKIFVSPYFTELACHVMPTWVIAFQGTMPCHERVESRQSHMSKPPSSCKHVLWKYTRCSANNFVFPVWKRGRKASARGERCAWTG